MIQFNLLPDIKLEYIKAKRVRRTVILTASLITAVSFSIFILLFVTVNIFQQKHINDLSKDIDQQKSELASFEDLDKILTIQSQLGSMTELHERKPVVGRLFDFLPEVVPQSVSLNSIEMDYETASIEFKGTADSLTTVNKFVDTLKFTQYSVEESDEKVNAFGSVVLDQFSVEPEEANYTITLTFDPLIFDINSAIELTVPNIISTRSETEKPSDNLFIEPSNEGAAQ